MDVLLLLDGIGTSLPFEEGPQGEMLDNGKFRQDLRIVHLHHALEGVSIVSRLYPDHTYLVDLAPPGLYA